MVIRASSIAQISGPSLPLRLSPWHFPIAKRPINRRPELSCCNYSRSQILLSHRFCRVQAFNQSLLPLSRLSGPELTSREEPKHVGAIDCAGGLAHGSSRESVVLVRHTIIRAPLSVGSEWTMTLRGRCSSENGLYLDSHVLPRRLSQPAASIDKAPQRGASSGA